MRLTFRPLPNWPHPVTSPRTSGRFRATYSATLRLLEFELIHLHAHSVVVGAGFRESDLFKHHPDHGGEQRDMVDVLAFRDHERAAV